jgi:hypothetical protein
LSLIQTEQNTKEEEEEEATAIIFLNQQSHEANGLHMCIFYGKLDVAIYAGRSKNTDPGKKKKANNNNQLHLQYIIRA